MMGSGIRTNRNIAGNAAKSTTKHPETIRYGKRPKLVSIKGSALSQRVANHKPEGTRFLHKAARGGNK
jgi:hypothetical protein